MSIAINDTLKKQFYKEVGYDIGNSDANTYCSDINLGGYNNGRVPNITELTSLIDHNEYNTPNQAPIANAGFSY